MGKYMPQGDLKDSNHVAAWATAHSLIEVLTKCGDNLTRENVMKQAASFKGFVPPMLVPGIKLNTSATDFYPIQAVQLSKFTGETFVRFGDVIASESE